MKSNLFKALTVIVALFPMVAVFTVTPTFAADEYPSRPVRLVVPTEPGGTQDIIARFIAPQLSKSLGRPVIVENKAGAGSVLGTEYVAKSAPDGYTLALVSGAYCVLPSMQKLPYDALKSFKPVSLLGTVAFALVTNPNVPANSLKELIVLAKQKPGQLIFGASGIGATPHMATELLKITAGINIKIIQFKGSGPITNDLLGGHHHATIMSLPSITPHIKSGRVKILGISQENRSPFMPDVPTFAESGLAGYDVRGSYGILAPAGTPAPIVDRLSKEIEAVLKLSESKDWFTKEGLEMNYLGPNEYARFIEKEVATWKKVVKDADIKTEF